MATRKAVLCWDWYEGDLVLNIGWSKSLLKSFKVEYDKRSIVDGVRKSAMLSTVTLAEQWLRENGYHQYVWSHEKIGDEFADKFVGLVKLGGVK